MSGNIFARGAAKTLAAVVETTYGVAPTTGGQLLRRTGSSLNPIVQEIDSQEILSSQQMRDSRQGPRQVQGQLDGYLAPATYQILMENLLRSTFAAGASISSVTDGVLTITAPTGGNAGSITLAGSSENFLTSGFKVGDIVRLSGDTSPATADSGVNLLTTGVSANLLTFAYEPSMVGFTTGQTIGVAVYGKKLLIPSLLTAQNVGSLTFEHWYSDVGVSEVSTGCRVTSMALNVPPAGFATFQSQILGQSFSYSNTQLLPNAAPESTNTLLTATNGKLIYKGVPIAIVTGFSLTVAQAAMAQPVVGSNTVPNVFVGTFHVDGQFTALMIADSMTADFLTEQEFTLALEMTTADSPSSDFVQIFLPRVKLTSETKNDSDREITRSFGFIALEQAVLGGTGLAYDDTTIVIQDSLAA